MGGEKNLNAFRRGVLPSVLSLPLPPISGLIPSTPSCSCSEFATPESPRFTNEEQLRLRVGKGPVPGREQVVSAELRLDIPGLPNQKATVRGKRGLSVACHHG